MQQVSVLETNIGSSTTGNSADTQIIFNDAGTLRGDTGLVFNKTTDALTVAGLVTAGSATITGDLTVRTNKLAVTSTGVGVNIATPLNTLHVNGEVTLPINNLQYWNAYYSAGFKSVAAGYAGYNGFATNGDFLLASTDTSAAGPTSVLAFYNRYRISNAGIHTWETVGGVAGTAMTLNSTGLGIGVVPSLYKFEVGNGGSDTRAIFNPNNAFSIGVKNGANQIGGWIGSAGNNILTFSGNDGTMKVTIDNTGNVGVGVTPSAWNSSYRVLEIGRSGNAFWGQSGVSGVFMSSNALLNSVGSFVYSNTAASTYYTQNTGRHEWYNAASGTAGASAAVTSGQSYTVSVLGSSTLAQWQAFFSALTVLPTVGQVVTATATGSIVGGGTVTQNITFTQAMTLDVSGNLLVGSTSGTFHRVMKNAATGAPIMDWVNFGSNGAVAVCTVDRQTYASANAAACALRVGDCTGGSRSINASGSINANGADYAEYMTKAGDFTIEKGDVAGIDANGMLTNVFADAVSFVVKSTDPSYVGNDNWGTGIEGAEFEAARELVDRIAFAGQVPVNVTGATAGDYIVPVINGTGIKGISVSNPTFEQYKLAVGKVITIDADGRARIIVKVA